MLFCQRNFKQFVNRFSSVNNKQTKESCEWKRNKSFCWIKAVFKCSAVMRLFAGLLGVFLLVALSNANVAQRRTYRNTEEILVPVTIIKDGEEIKEPANLKENEKEAEIKNLQPEVIAENIAAAAVEEEQKLEAVEAVVEAQRRIDEAIVEEEIDEAIKEEQDKEIEQVLDGGNNLKTSLAEVSEIVVANKDKEAVQEPAEQAEKAADYKSVVIAAQSPEQVVVIVEDSENANNANDEAQQPEGTIRQATQATPTQTTTQQNFVQQLIQNSPLGQFFNQITGQTTQVASDETAAAPVPTLPGLFNPVTAVQNAAQSVVNSTTQAFQGFQQFASSLGNQFQSTLSGLGVQPQSANDATTARPPGPIQQLVNTFLPQQAQPAPAQQGPLQGLFNIFQGNNRPQQNAAPAAVNENSATPPTQGPEFQEPTQTAAVAAETIDQTNNEIRGSGEANDSFEESVQPEELIVVNDDVSQTENDSEQEVANN